MSTKHTPGPWTVHRGSWSEDGNAQYELEGVKVLQAADAYLIAAAPELLASLHETASMLQAACIVITDKAARQMALETVNEARAVIAKATGEKA